MIIEFACKTGREGTFLIGEVRSAFNLIAIALPPSAIDNYRSCPLSRSPAHARQLDRQGP